MADISNEIKKFKEAVYGEEVRGALVSLAEKVNVESEAAEMASEAAKGYSESAKGYMESASGYMTVAETEAREARNYADLASQSASGATQSELNASQSALRASGSADDAKKAALTASGAASSASGAASSASQSASDVQKAKSDIETEIETFRASIVVPAPNGWAHNGIYRGKFLGYRPSKEQYESIANGTFDDMYIGDYFIFNHEEWRIAAFDYYYDTGDNPCRNHHVLLVKDYYDGLECAMYDSPSTASGYAGSIVRSTRLNVTQGNLEVALGGSDHILNHRILITNAARDGHPTGVEWVDSKIEILTEQMVYGSGIFRAQSNGLQTYALNTVEKTQLPLFFLNPSLIGIGVSYWLRDICSITHFARVTNAGVAHSNSSHIAEGVRPYFCIK